MAEIQNTMQLYLVYSNQNCICKNKSKYVSFLGDVEKKCLVNFYAFIRLCSFHNAAHLITLVIKTPLEGVTGTKLRV